MEKDPFKTYNNIINIIRDTAREIFHHCYIPDKDQEECLITTVGQRKQREIRDLLLGFISGPITHMEEKSEMKDWEVKQYYILMTSHRIHEFLATPLKYHKINTDRPVGMVDEKIFNMIKKLLQEILKNINFFKDL